MRRFRNIIIMLILTAMLAVSVSAVTGASKLSSFSTVSQDGSCQVSMTLTLHLESAVNKLYFPVPAEATGISLNGSRVSTTRSDGARQINLSRLVRGVVGDVTVNIHYSIRDVIKPAQANLLEMQLPLLSGFQYPVESMEFSVTLPGAIDVLPSFVSGYHQARIEEDLTYQVEGATITGSSLKAMKDHETLTMILSVTEEMFPRSITQIQDYASGENAMLLCAVVALIFWMIFLWNLPVLPKNTAEPPEGFHAGQIGCIVGGRGIDLSLMVLSWAQLGYVLLQSERNGRVLIHKQMDMGNERSDFEQRCFAKLFGKREVVDTTSYHYAQLCRMTAKRTDGMKELLRGRNIYSRIFRTIASGIGLFGGACLAVALAKGAALQGFLIFVLSVVGAISGWLIQDFGAGLLLGHRRSLQISLLLSLLWALIGIFAGAFPVAIKMIGGLMLAGIFLAWGGRRTALGKQTQAQILGLQYYLRTVDKAQVAHICQTDADYFFRLIPFALALGADTAFAKRFGSEKLEHCPYLFSGAESSMTALQWCEVMRRTLNSMNDRAEKLPLEKLLGLLHSMMRR